MEFCRTEFGISIKKMGNRAYKQCEEAPGRVAISPVVSYDFGGRLATQFCQSG